MSDGRRISRGIGVTSKREAIPHVPAWQLAVRFALEVGSLVALGNWSFHAVPAGATAWVAGLALPAFAAAIWVTFAVPGDPSRSGRAPVPVPGWARFALELAVFLGGAAALWALHRSTALAVFIAALLVHHLVTPARHLWLLRQ
jgi:hypothetical protein